MRHKYPNSHSEPRRLEADWRNDLFRTPQVRNGKVCFVGYEI